MSHAGFFGRIARDQVPAVVGLTFAFTLLFVIFYGGASALSALVPWRFRVDFSFEQHIPFVPEASAVYLSMIFLLGMAPFVLRDLQRIWRLFCVLSFETLVGACVFVLFPVEPAVADSTLRDTPHALFTIADWLNLERNDVPSLHVAFTFTATLAYLERARLIGKVVLVFWAVCIVLSTLLTRQHQMVDVVAGIALAWVSWHYIGAWARRPATIDAADVEILCLHNFARFSRRHTRYFFISCTLLWKSVPAFRARRLLRTGFAFLQAVDDLLDGDRPCEREPLEITDALVIALQRDAFANDSLSRLARAFRADLVARGGTAALDQAVALIRVMQHDRRRVLGGSLLDTEALCAHHRDTFHHSLDLMLLAADVELRSADVPELMDALGWCSTVRDLEEDLARGLINIPREVMEAAKGEMPDATPTDLMQSTAVREWLADEADRILPILDRIDARLAELSHRSGAQVLAIFSRSIRRYADRAQSSATSGWGIRSGSLSQGVRESAH